MFCGTKPVTRRLAGHFLFQTPLFRVTGFTFFLRYNLQLLKVLHHIKAELSLPGFYSPLVSRVFLQMFAAQEPFFLCCLFYVTLFDVQTFSQEAKWSGNTHGQSLLFHSVLFRLFSSDSGDRLHCVYIKNTYIMQGRQKGDRGPGKVKSHLRDGLH